MPPTPRDGAGPRPVPPLSPRTVLRNRHVVAQPCLVAPLPYLNFLRHLKTNVFKRYGMRRLLQEAPPLWDALTKAQKRSFEPERVVSRMVRQAKANRARRLLFRSRQGQTGRGSTKVRRPIYDKRPVPLRRRKRASKPKSKDQERGSRRPPSQ
ncbi:uncharacterized protein ddbt [Drosophila bipectinata]|uniref:uncharacterized protein ddbt n=1 Tax=Drosophila bipectinata TaxID=42026 RepID=UPI001C89F3AC|nr:uncharacterized protein LOC108121470 [Drosophila bipectinata]